jgi:hypothetical protein
MGMSAAYGLILAAADELMSICIRQTGNFGLSYVLGE